MTEAGKPITADIGAGPSAIAGGFVGFGDPITITQQFSDIAFGQSASTVAVSLADVSVQLRNTRNGRLALRLASPVAHQPAAGSSSPFPPHISFAGTLAAGRVAEAFETHAHTWDLRNGAVVGQHDIVTTDLDTNLAQLSSSGRRLVVMTWRFDPSGQDVVPTVHAYGATALGWALERSFAAVTATVNDPPCPCVATSPDGRVLAESTHSNLTLFNLDNGTTLWSQKAHGGPVWFSATGQSLLTVSRTGYGSAAAGLVALSLAYGSLQFALRDVAVESETPPFVIQAGDHVRLALSAGNSASVTDWTFSTADFVAAACRVANRDLSTDEWSREVGTFDAYERTCPTSTAASPKRA